MPVLGVFLVFIIFFGLMGVWALWAFSHRLIEKENEKDKRRFHKEENLREGETRVQ